MNKIIISGILPFLFAGALSAQEQKEEATPAPLPEENIGFRKDSIIGSWIGGDSLGASGSLIDFEKSYNRALMTRTTLNATPFKFLTVGFPGIVLPFSVKPGDNGHVELEYGLLSYLGVGFVYHTYTLSGTQQESMADITGNLQTFSFARESIMPVPSRYKLFNGKSYMLEAVFHPMPRSRFDPYLAVRAGYSVFTTRAHSTLNFDPYRFYIGASADGTGVICGAGLGVNLHVMQKIGFKLELTGYRSILHAETFNGRSMGTAHIQFGIFLNYSGLYAGKR